MSSPEQSSSVFTMSPPRLPVFGNETDGLEAMQRSESVLSQVVDHSTHHAAEHLALAALKSPSMTPRMATGLQHGAGYFSPNQPVTEPRSFAPQMTGLIHAPVPPQGFNLDLVAYQPPVTRGADTFGAQQQQSGMHVTDGHSRHSSVSSALVQIPQTGLSGMPTLSYALDLARFPFVEGGKQARPKNHGVVRLQNIPFGTPQSEVVALFGRTSRILNDADEPVHIIMERMTGKTMDAYVEFCTFEDAMKAVERHQRNQKEGRPSHIGQRVVTVSLASQADLMQDLFPTATGLKWNGVNPEFSPVQPHEPWKNFKGFVTEEEMTMLAKHAKVPNRTPFSRACPQRPYECLISTLKKFPWQLTDRITIAQRYAIFKATYDLVEELAHRLQREHTSADVAAGSNKLTPQLLHRVVSAALACPGFTPLMKDDISSFIELNDADFVKYGLPRCAGSWRHQYAMTPKLGVSHDILEWYIAIIREQTQRDLAARPFTDRAKFQEMQTDMYWGFFWAEVGFPTGSHFDDMTLAQAAHLEFSAMERILARALPQN